MVEKELVRDSNSLRDNFLTLINTKDIMNTVEIQQNFDRFLCMRVIMKVGTTLFMILFNLLSKVVFNVFIEHDKFYGVIVVLEDNRPTRPRTFN